MLGGRPDIVALDENAHVVVVEIKRDVERTQLAQCLEYAGWARSTSLDELARLYHRTESEFFRDWQAFTDSTAPVILARAPRLILIARDFHGRTESALEFLIENGLPVKVIRVSLYEDQQNRKFLDVEGEHEPDFAPSETEPVIGDDTKIRGRRVRITDLMDAGLLDAGDELIWDRPRLGVSYSGALTENGAIRLSDGSVHSSPSRAATTAANVPAYDGWYAWRVPSRGSKSLNDLRRDLLRQQDLQP